MSSCAPCQSQPTYDLSFLHFSPDGTSLCYTEICTHFLGLLASCSFVRQGWPASPELGHITGLLPRLSMGTHSSDTLKGPFGTLQLLMKTDFDSVRLGGGCRFSISNHFPSDADVAGLYMRFEGSGASAENATP